MSQEQVCRCDATACRAEIPAGAKRFEYHGAVVVINGQSIEHRSDLEVCSAACLLAVSMALVKDATENKE